MRYLKTGVLLFIIAAYGACAGPAKDLYLPGPNEPTTSVYLVSHGWHVGIAVKRADIPSGIWPESLDFPHAEYLEVGWGDWDFYQSRDPGAWVTFKAALLPTASVLHVVGFRGRVESYFPYSEIIELELSQRSFERLSSYLHNSFKRDGVEGASPLGPGLYGDSRFYPARGKFHLLNTCNVWTARALRAAGYPFTSVFAITADSVMSQARPFGKVIRSCRCGHVNSMTVQGLHVPLTKAFHGLHQWALEGKPSELAVGDDAKPYVLLEEESPAHGVIFDGLELREGDPTGGHLFTGLKQFRRTQ